MADDTRDTDDGNVVTDSPDVGHDELTEVDRADNDVLTHVSPSDGDSDSGDGHAHRVRTRTQRRRWPWVVALTVVTGLLAASIVVTYEATQRANAWSAQVEEANEISYELGLEIAASRTENVRLGDQIALLDEQLSNSKDTVLKLSGEKAQWRDDTEFAQQQVEATEEMVTQATSVANSLQRCTEGQIQLLEYVTTSDPEAEDYDPVALSDYRASVTELCSNAQEANAELQRALAE